jgi:putative membrane protein
VTAEEHGERTALTTGERAREWLVIFLKGMFMGAADAVPGVSGGTIALITGIYERLITAVTNVDPLVVTLLPGIRSAAGRKRFRARLVEMDVPFLLVLGAGIATALVTVAGLVEAAESTVPALLFAFFFGLIAASAVVLRDEVDLSTPGRIGAAIAGFTFAFVLAGGVTGSLPHTLPVLLVAGAVAICAMILPGISGAFILLLLGQYLFLTETLSTFFDGLFGLLGGGPLAAAIEPGVVVVVFGTGAVIGLFSISHAVRFALDRYREATLTFLVALMVGALRLPAREVFTNVSAWTPGRTLAILGVTVVGALAVLVVDHYTAEIDY